MIHETRTPKFSIPISLLFELGELELTAEEKKVIRKIQDGYLPLRKRVEDCLKMTIKNRFIEAKNAYAENHSDAEWRVLVETEASTKEAEDRAKLLRSVARKGVASYMRKQVPLLLPIARRLEAWGIEVVKARHEIEAADARRFRLPLEESEFLLALRQLSGVLTRQAKALENPDEQNEQYGALSMLGLGSYAMEYPKPEEASPGPDLDALKAEPPPNPEKKRGGKKVYRGAPTDGTLPPQPQDKPRLLEPDPPRRSQGSDEDPLEGLTGFPPN